MSALSSILGLKLANQAAAANLPSASGCKSLVCILMAGGNDTFNVLMRRDQEGYDSYAASRTNLAIPQSEIIALSPDNPPPSQVEQYGLHPSCQPLADMFNGTGAFAGKRRLSFIANIGTLIQPTTKSDYLAGTTPAPKALFSHIDQITQWQTSVPQGQSQAVGWGGRMADVLHSQLNVNSTASSMSISLAGNNTFQVGNRTAQFAVTGNGALLPTGDDPNLSSPSGRRNFAVQNMLEGNYNNLVQQAYASHASDSIAAQRAFGEVFDQIEVPQNLIDNFPTRFGQITKFGSEMLAAARTLQARQQFGLARSTIFASYGGWDHHGGLLEPHQAMMAELSQAISAYQLVLEHFGIEEEVITYTASDFGRTLRSNGRGTDHAWGGNQMVFGGPVSGGEIKGTFPDLSLNSSDDIGFGGRILPTTSIDEFFAELAVWFGVSTADMDYVLPNLTNFVTDIATNQKPVGFLT